MMIKNYYSIKNYNFTLIENILYHQQVESPESVNYI